MKRHLDHFIFHFELFLEAVQMSAHILELQMEESPSLERLQLDSNEDVCLGKLLDGLRFAYVALSLFEKQNTYTRGYSGNSEFQYRKAEFKMGLRLIIAEGVELFNNVFKLLSGFQVDPEQILLFLEGSGRLFEQERERHVVDCLLKLKVPEQCQLEETWGATQTDSQGSWEMG